MNIEDFQDIFEPFDKLVEIEILGETVSVPENNNLLRCFQYLALEAISMGEFCWNGDCANCQIWIESESGEKPALACRTKVEARMKIVRMNEEISLESPESRESN
ncbi:MAG TPA: 2Fe-2S iron-sulfur cluster-binding protein [Pyrinomonadaceae bacterium]